MTAHEKLSYFAASAPMGVTVMALFLKGTVVSELEKPARWLRLQWLKMRGMQEYVGRHRLELAA